MLEYSMHDAQNSKPLTLRDVLYQQAVHVYSFTHELEAHEPLRSALRLEVLEAMRHAEYASKDAKHHEALRGSLAALSRLCALAHAHYSEHGFDILEASFMQLRHVCERTTRQAAPKAAVSEAAQPVQSEPSVEQQKTVQLNERQKRILSYVFEQKEVQMSAISDLFPQTSQRTVRRDVEWLCEERLLLKEGSTRGAIYAIGQK